MIFALLWCVQTSFESGKLNFSITVNGLKNQYKVMTFSLMPEEEAEIICDPNQADCHILDENTGQDLKVENRKTYWQAPKTPGLYRLLIKYPSSDTMTINILIKTPLKPDKNGYQEGFHIGFYPDIPLKNLEVYNAPVGLVKVTPDLLDLQVSPHFKLRQFLCKQEGDFPKFILIRTRLLMKLEYLLALCNAKGYAANTFAVLSGFRTPYYNKRIGNVQYSRHQWGGAADIFIDEDQDGMMDDLNGDGTINVQDAALLYQIFDKESYKEGFRALIGGLGQYRKTQSHGPFVHIDVRGFRARWGT